MRTIICFFLSFLIVSSTHAVQAKAESPTLHPCDIAKKLPYLSPGCEGEACGLITYGRNIAPIDLYSSHTTPLKKAGVLETCSEPQKVEHYLKLKSLGSALVKNTTSQIEDLGVKKGDHVAVTTSLGEGFVSLCLLDKEIMAYASSGPSGSGRVEPVVEIIEHPKNETWLKIQSKNKTYWSPYHDQAFMEYYSYEPHKLCEEDHPLGAEFKKTGGHLKSLISSTLAEQCKKHRGCPRSDPTQSCPLESDLHSTLIPEISSLGRLRTCAALSITEDICQSDFNSRPGTLSFTCNFQSERPELQERLQISFNFRCSNGDNGFDCHSSQL